MLIMQCRTKNVRPAGIVRPAWLPGKANARVTSSTGVAGRLPTTPGTAGDRSYLLLPNRDKNPIPATRGCEFLRNARELGARKKACGTPYILARSRVPQRVEDWFLPGPGRYSPSYIEWERLDLKIICLFGLLRPFRHGLSRCKRPNSRCPDPKPEQDQSFNRAVRGPSRQRADAWVSSAPSKSSPQLL